VWLWQLAQIQIPPAFPTVPSMGETACGAVSPTTVRATFCLHLYSALISMQGAMRQASTEELPI
jgi:hypothetical protein